MSKSEAAQDFPSREASLKGYFETIASTLKEKVRLCPQPLTLVISLVLHNKHSNAYCHFSVQEFSYCAWAIVRNEILRTLRFILDDTVLFKSSEV